MLVLAAAASAFTVGPATSPWSRPAAAAWVGGSTGRRSQAWTLLMAIGGPGATDGEDEFEEEDERLDDLQLDGAQVCVPGTSSAKKERRGVGSQGRAASWAHASAPH